jgi:hypothetical protein
VSSEPHHRYFELSGEEQRQVREILGRKVRAGQAPSRDLIEAAINVILARRAWRRGPASQRGDSGEPRRRWS